MPVWQTYDKPWTADPIRPVPGLGWWGTGPGGTWGPAPTSVPAWATWMGGSAEPTGNAGGYSGAVAPGAVPGGASMTLGGGLIRPGGGSGLNISPIPGTNYNGSMPGAISSFASPNPQMTDAISGLFTRGLVPDVLRQAAETSAGRGIAGSPAGYSTAVRMTENEYLKRLGLANDLLSGEAGRTLPYQITPYQQAILDLQRQQLEQQRLGALASYANRNRGGGGGGGGGDITGWSRPPTTPSYPSGAGGNWGTGPFGSYLSGSMLSGGRGGGYPETLDDVYEWLGFGNMGSRSGDLFNEFKPQSYDEFSDWIGMPPDQGFQTEFWPESLNWDRNFSVYD